MFESKTTVARNLQQFKIAYRIVHIYGHKRERLKYFRNDGIDNDFFIHVTNETQPEEQINRYERICIYHSR